MTDNQDIVKGIIQLIIIVVMTILYFSYFSKKTQDLKKLLPLVVISVWLSVSIILGLEYLFLRDSNAFSSFGGIMSLMKESLPMFLIFGGLAFFIKYRSFKKKK
ncbi:MAG: hypothetical protein JXR05_10610 [Flavobacteriaceae bacterium]